jgi:hypothetical protein
MNDKELLEAILEGMPILRWFETREEVIEFLRLNIETINSTDANYNSLSETVKKDE